MIPEPLTVRSAIFMILAGVLANNYIFEKALGAAPMFGYRRNRDLPLLGLLSLKLSVPVLIIAFAAILVVLILVRFIVAQKQKRRGDHADEKNQ